MALARKRELGYLLVLIERVDAMRFDEDRLLRELRAERARLIDGVSSIDRQIAERERYLRHLYGDAAPEGPAPNASSPKDSPGVFHGLARPAAVHKALELSLDKKPLTARQIADVLAAHGVSLKTHNPVHSVQTALNRRRDSHGDVVHVGRGMWGLVSWYTEAELRSFAESASKVGARDTKFHAEKMREGIKKAQAQGVHYGPPPKIRPEQWERALELVRDGERKISKIYREIIKLTPPGEKPMVFETLRARKDELFRQKPYPEAWRNYFANRPNSKDADATPSIRVVK